MGKNTNKKRKASKAVDMFPLSMAPNIPSGALCASQSEATDASDCRLDLDVFPVNLEYFFDDHMPSEKKVYAAAKALPDVQKACAKALSSKGISKESLRDAVLTYLVLRQEPIRFLGRSLSTISSNGSKRLYSSTSTKGLTPSREVSNKNHTFTYNEESNLSSLLDASTEFVVPSEVEENPSKRMMRLMGGCL